MELTQDEMTNLLFRIATTWGVQASLSDRDDLADGAKTVRLFVEDSYPYASLVCVVLPTGRTYLAMTRTPADVAHHALRFLLSMKLGPAVRVLTPAAHRTAFRDDTLKVSEDDITRFRTVRYRDNGDGTVNARTAVFANAHTVRALVRFWAEPMAKLDDAFHLGRRADGTFPALRG